MCMYQRNGNGAVSIAQLSRPEPKKNLRFKGLIIRAVLSQRPSLTWHSSQQWRKKEKTEVEETRTAVQHASLYLVFLLESSHQKIPFQPLFVRMHKLFFSPGFPLQLCEKSVPFGSRRDSTVSVIFFTRIESIVWTMHSIGYATNTGINFIDLDDFQTLICEMSRNVRRNPISLKHSTLQI